MNLFGASTPVLVDSGDAKSVVLGVKLFSEVPGQVLGCSFYKAPSNLGGHVVSLWDASGKVLATQAATAETASGKQSVVFATPVQIAANQTFVCGYFAPQGHYSDDDGYFKVQKDVPPLHIPVNGGVAVYSTQATAFPTGVFFASNYWIDVLFVPSASPGINLFGSAAPALSDSGDAKSVVLGVKVFSDVPGQVLGCSFYKAPTNLGVHVVSLWDATGKLLATKTATAETASGKQSVLFASPVQIAANQTFVCGYLAPQGHYSDDDGVFTVQKDVPPLHVPVNGGVAVYGTQATAFPTDVYQAANYGVDVLFVPLSSNTWISGVSGATTANTANITWRTSAPSDSQVDYGPNTSYGSSTDLSTAMVSDHSASLSNLSPGTTYHFRVRSRDSDAVAAIGRDYVLTIGMPVSVSASPANATILSGATQQFTALVSNSFNTAVTWSATAGTVSTSGLFKAPTVTSATPVTVTATSQADPTKSASAALTVNPAAAVLTVNPASLSFAGQVGASNLTPASVSITNAGAGTLTFTGVSDQPWLMLSAGSGTAPSTLQVSPAISGLKAGTYTGHVTLTGGGTAKAVTVVLTMTAPPVQHSVALSWNASANPKVVSYSMYRSSFPGSSYGLLASALGTASYSDPSVQSGGQYYYVVTAVDDQGRESAYSNEIKATIP